MSPRRSYCTYIISLSLSLFFFFFFFFFTSQFNIYSKLHANRLIVHHCSISEDSNQMNVAPKNAVLTPNRGGPTSHLVYVSLEHISLTEPL